MIAVAIPRLRRCNIHHVFRKPGKMITLSLRSIFDPFNSPFPTQFTFISSAHLGLFLVRMSQNSCASASHRSGTGGRLLEAIETLALAIFLPQNHPSKQLAGLMHHGPFSIGSLSGIIAVARFAPNYSTIEMITKVFRTQDWSANLETSVFLIAELSLQLETERKGCM